MTSLAVHLKTTPAFNINSICRYCFAFSLQVGPLA